MTPAFLNGCAVYRQFREDLSDYTADYRELTLDGVWVREVFAADPDGVESGSTVLYFFPGQSGCYDENGSTAAFPRPKNGDLVVLHADTEDERVLRVAESGYYMGSAGNSHVRLKLK